MSDPADTLRRAAEKVRSGFPLTENCLLPKPLRGALADWLDERADVACPARWWGEGCGDTGDCLVHRHALAVARLLLGNQQ